MKLTLLNLRGNFFSKYLTLAAIALTAFSLNSIAQGTWTAVTNPCPGASGGGMLVLSDGSILCKTFSGGSDGYGNLYYKLKPDASGSYINGTWSAIAPMLGTRLYYSSQVLKDGRVYVAGGEYGTGGSKGETYNPLTNTWTATPLPGAFVSDANSEILDNGVVLQAIVQGTPFLKQTKFYDPATNTYSAAPSCLGYHNESSWVKLPDGSILMADRDDALTHKSERYIPSLNSWVADANTPASLFDPYGLETGAALLLPDGRAFYIGSLGNTAYYTPSGTNSPGSWAAGPNLPNTQGQPDGPAAMMPNGKILLACSPVPTSANHFPAPTSFYEFDPSANAFTRINAPTGGLTINASCYTSNLIVLPDGNILYGQQGSTTFYVYTPGGTAVASGKPKINTLSKVVGSPGTFRAIGTGFNGISEGSSYGDDWQSASNYPLLRITATSTGGVFYARTFNWNSTGVVRGTKKDTVSFTPPAGLPRGTSYSVVVVANGIASDPVVVPGAAFSSTSSAVEITSATNAQSADFSIAAPKIASQVYPNPAKDFATVQFSLSSTSHVAMKVVDLSGREISTVLNSNLQAGSYTQKINVTSFRSGIYFVRIITDKGSENVKLIVQ